MYTITIEDPKIYLGGEIFARENHSSLKELVNKYVASLAAKVLSQKTIDVPYSEAKEFKEAMQFMDSFVADDLAGQIPMDDNGKGALAHVKYGV